MTSSRNKVIISSLAIVTLAFVTLTFTDAGTSVATVIKGTEGQSFKCIQALPEAKRGGNYTFERYRIDTDATKDMVLTATSEAQCGSAGCTHELCLIEDTEVQIVPFGYAAETLFIKDTVSNGMYDIQLQGKSTTNLEWDGTRYIIQQ